MKKGKKIKNIKEMGGKPQIQVLAAPRGVLEGFFATTLLEADKYLKNILIYIHIYI